MFCVSQMLSLTEFAAGSRVSTLTALASVSVSLGGVVPPPLEPLELDPQPARSAAAASAAAVASSPRARAPAGRPMRRHGRSAIDVPFIGGRNAERRSVESRVTSKILDVVCCIWHGGRLLNASA